MIHKSIIVTLLGLFTCLSAYGQQRPLRYYIEKDSSSYVGMSVAGQVWMRQNENNPGTLINGEPSSHFFDISVRRVRLQAYARLNNRTNIVLSLGQNNINYLTARFGEIRLLDFYVDHQFTKHLTIGAGQSGWNGVSRYAAPSALRTLTLDIPVVAIPTVNQTDNILRKLSAYANGQWKQWDYRLVFSRPYAPIETTSIGSVSNFAFAKTGIQTAAYLKYQFFEHESLISPFHVGTYEGRIKVLALGAGFENQPRAMWHLNAAADTVLTPMRLLAMDIFAELPLGHKDALTFYTAYYNDDFGPNFIRIIGLNNVGSGVDANGTFSRTGNAWPAIGTGNTIYYQLGYLWTFSHRKEMFQPFFSGQHSSYDRLGETVNYYEGGINLLMDGQKSKLTFAIQNRPIFDALPSGNIMETTRRNSFILQYQMILQ
ncbi:MAG TPA: hypothetical protein VK921_12755 [Anditalea sp.]|nr:hypothetical protein [Anditalea sp.]